MVSGRRYNCELILRESESEKAARSCQVLQKFSAQLMDVLQQIAEGESGRVVLEESLPGLVVSSR